jgi:hypothetical protein
MTQQDEQVVRVRVEAEEGAAESNDLHERGRFAEQELLSHQKSVSEVMRAADFTKDCNAMQCNAIQCNRRGCEAKSRLCRLHTRRLLAP